MSGQYSTPKVDVMNMRPSGLMQPAKEFCVAREAFRWDQQLYGLHRFLLLSFVVCFCWWTIFFVINRFHSM